VRYFLSILIIVATLNAISLEDINEEVVKNQIARMLIIGFENNTPQSQQLTPLIEKLKSLANKSILISIGKKGKNVAILKTQMVREFEPYKKLIQSNNVDIIIPAHLFNFRLDKKYPVTLSYKINTELLRDRLNYRAIIMSDCIQMRVVANHYSLKQSITLAINSGIDMFIFRDKLVKEKTDELINIIYKQLKNGSIKYKRILESNQRIKNLYTKISIVKKPIQFAKQRIQLTKKYIKTHYGLDVKNIVIEPKSIVLHWTGLMRLSWCFNSMNKEKIISDRAYIKRAGLLNVSAHFLVGRDGTIYQLMPDNWMARHTIGLNYNAIGIENIGGARDKVEDLTQAQVEANARLIEYLKQKYPTIEYLLGHLEYFDMEKTPLWLEHNKRYRTYKSDPGPKFMREVRAEVKELGLKMPVHKKN